MGDDEDDSNRARDRVVVALACDDAVAATIAAALVRATVNARAWTVNARAVTILAIGTTRTTREDVERAGGALRASDVGAPLARAIARAVRSSGAKGVDAREVDGAMEGETLADATTAVDCGGGRVSERCGVAVACERAREMGGRRVTHVWASASAVTGTVFEDGGRRARGERGLYDAARPTTAASMVERATTVRAERKCALHYEFLLSHPETAPLLGGKKVGGTTARAAPASASMCAIVGAIAAAKVLRALEDENGEVMSDDAPMDAVMKQWTHVDAMELYRPDRADAHAEPSSMDGYETVPSDGDGDETMEDAEDVCRGFEEQAKLYGYDAMKKLREMLVLVCGRDSQANDACATALGSIGVGTVDVFGASGSGTFLRQECDVDDLCDLDDLEAYKYHVIIRTSACPEANELVLSAHEVRTPVIEVESPRVGESIVHVTVGSGSGYKRGPFVGWMETTTALVAAHVAAMEVVRVAQDRPRNATIVCDDEGIFTQCTQ